FTFGGRENVLRIVLRIDERTLRKFLVLILIAEQELPGSDEFATVEFLAGGLASLLKIDRWLADAVFESERLHVAGKVARVKTGQLTEGRGPQRTLDGFCPASEPVFREEHHQHVGNVARAS